jgi:hypothetical protein
LSIKVAFQVPEPISSSPVVEALARSPIYSPVSQNPSRSGSISILVVSSMTPAFDQQQAGRSNWMAGTAVHSSHRATHDQRSVNKIDASRRPLIPIVERIVDQAIAAH